ncbi:MAG: tRNA (adenosine(37)-N6)-threonylcarbamoyltransferase complex ATPase subunit type 1 TsaE [Variovorax paradoxus]|uniref:tRNA threonylcarbamoyladenosine biosynthesis protein TsaE n=1 Tax=Variovorax paradoxus TaxID=34073 RepID=A0A2W5PD90_VARPD|nr:MAG: tRNA (adenosine(37)-N6)-threonylcarbamoyltransferase complex ATPase subunit type 1 TsaE [Variovorax paradoxus]
MSADDHPSIVGTPPPATATVQWRDEDDTDRFAQHLAAAPGLRDAFITLHGELGAGKTTFVRHLLRALGVTGRIKSPTYAVVEPHAAAGGLAIHHFDFYRFGDPREWDDAGFRDIFAAPGLADLAIKIEAMSDDDLRTVTLHAHTARGRELLAAATAA